jgi:hypothetical protein
MRAIAFLLATAALGAAEEWRAGPLTLEVHISRTANLFQIVDNLSNWSRYSHSQYRTYYEPLSDEDERQLARHADVRSRHGWGQGLEQTLLVSEELQEALRQGVARGHLSQADADIEKEVLEHFAPRIDELMEIERERLTAFRNRLHEGLPELAAFASKISRFCRGVEVTVPVHLIANPSDSNLGGGYNGGKLTLEVARERDAYPTFLHELMHAFVNPQRKLLEEARRGVEGLDHTTLNEGIAYALSPGLLFSGSDLAQQTAGDFAANRTMQSDPYVRFRRYGLALRPLLKEALDSEHATLDSFLPRAIDAWRVAYELDKGRRPARSVGKQAATLFSSGPGWRVLSKRVKGLYSFNHSADHYEKILARAAPGQTFVLMYALDDRDREIVKGYEDLLPRPWPEIEKELEAGRTVEAESKARGLRTVLLAAPTRTALLGLIWSTTLLEKVKRGPWFFSVGANGPHYGLLNRHLYKLHGRGVAGYSHDGPLYERLFERSQAGDTLILCFALETGDRIPAGYEDLLPLKWDRIEAQLKERPTLEATGSARELKTILLAGRTRADLAKLRTASKLLEP